MAAAKFTLKTTVRRAAVRTLGSNNRAQFTQSNENYNKGCGAYPRWHIKKIGAAVAAKDYK